MNTLGSESARQQQAPREELAYGCGQRRSADAHAAAEYEHGVKHDIQYRATDDTHHAKPCIALQAKLVVERQGRHHERCGQHNVSQVVIGIWHHPLRSAEQPAEGRKVGQAQRGSEGADNQRCEEPDRSHARRRRHLFGPEGAADIVAAAMAEKEAQRLDKSHVCKGDADTGGPLGREAAHEGSIDNVVERRGDHRYDGWHGHPADQQPHRLRRHLGVFVLDGQRRIISVLPCELSRCAVTVCAWPLRSKSTSTSSPGLKRPSSSINSAKVLTDLPATRRMMSP